jgi:hypothetical protein
VQPALWSTVNVCPPAVIVPVRCGPVFAAAVYPTVPLPDPVLPDVIVNQPASLLAAHPQPSLVFTSKVPDAPDAGADAVDDDRANVHPCPWLMVNVCPAIVSVPERPGPLVDATVKFTVPFPVPPDPDVIVIHDSVRVAVHAQPAAAVTFTEPVPPDDGTD